MGRPDAAVWCGRQLTVRAGMSNSDREEVCPPCPTPTDLSSILEGYSWARNTVGEAGGSVYRLYGKARAPDLYLKHGDGAVADDIVDEMVRMRWLAAQVDVPTIHRFTSSSTEAWLLMEAMPGRTACQWLTEEPDNQIAVVDALARFLNRLHAIPVTSCPFNSGHQLRLARARERLDAGLVDADDFDDERAGLTAREVWDQMMALGPIAPDPVVTHGDFSLDNVLLENGEVTGCIDLGRVGVADRYQDLAVLWNGLRAFDPLLQKRLLESYGIQQPDVRKLDFHLMLDEFF